MNEKLRKIINHYGVNKQLKYLQSEVFELNEAIIKNNNRGVLETVSNHIVSVFAPLSNIEYKDYSKEHIKEELADVMVMLKQIQLHYNIPTKEINKVMRYKTDRTLEKIKEEIVNE